MRPEYFEAIRYRRWAELEYYAKKRNDQALADTVYQLAETIGDKQDRRALKKILWILAQKGIQGGDYEQAPTTPKAKPKLVGPASITIGPGERHTTFALTIKRGMDMDGMMMTLLDEFGYCLINPLARISMLHVNGAMDAMMRSQPEFKARIPGEYALYRMARAYQHRQFPLEDKTPVSSAWKKAFEVVERVPHPVEGTPFTEQNSETRLRWLQELYIVNTWRLTLPWEAEVWSEIHPLRWNLELSDQDRVEATAEILYESREKIFTEWAGYIWYEKLLDTAYVLCSKDHAGGPILLDVAHDLDRRRTNSDFVSWLIMNTAANMPQVVEEDDYDVNDFACAA